MWAQRISGYSPAIASDTAWIWAPRDWYIGKGDRRIVLANHGHGGSDAWGSDVSLFDPTYHVWKLVRAGYVVIALNNGGPATFSNPITMESIKDAYNWCVNTVKMPTSKIGLLAWSMGGLVSLNYHRRFPNNVAASWLWTPVCDMEWINGTSGYTAPYSVGTVGYPTSYSSEITSAYSASTTTSGVVTIPTSGGGVTLPVSNANNFSDAQGLAVPTASLNGSNFKWTSKSWSAFYGCVSTGALSIVVASGQTVSSTSDKQRGDYNPLPNAASFRGIPGKLRIATALDDATIPYAQSRYFVQQVNDPNVSFRSVAAGGHTHLFADVTFDEFVEFYDSGAWS